MLDFVKIAKLVSLIDSYLRVVRTRAGNGIQIL